jgi:putative hydrolase of the HAD superfamily
MIKAMIFDFGGVLVLTEDSRPRHAWDERLRLPAGSVERAIHHSDLWIQAQLGRVSYRAYWEGVAEMLRMRPEDIPPLRQDYFSGDRLNYRLVSLLRDLKSEGYTVALLANEMAQLRNRLKELQIDTLFDHVLISAEIGVMKPDPTAYRVALQALEAGPQQTILVDDSLVNVRGAQPLGIHTILFRPEIDLRSELMRTWSISLPE